ncbi:MAG TPA: chemotaxis protein CheW [Polyangiaceae bacterium]|nr:chemotaxis protein CheW [Polyangiaceae bacterium]
MAASKQRPDPRKSLVGFVVGDVAYAVPIAQVQEIVAPLGLTELPHAPAAVAGVADHRGQVIPIVDLRARFKLPPLPDRRRAKWILLRSDDRTFGLAVDRVTDVFGTGGVEIRPAPPLGGGEESRGIVGVTSYEGALVFVLDVDRLDALVSSIAPPSMPPLELR